MCIRDRDNSYKLENQIDERVQTNHDIISKNFSHIITNALLFVDVLCYNIYLKTYKVPENYLKKIEEIILSTITSVSYTHLDVYKRQT